MRLPNGYGNVHKLPGNRRRPWRARVTTGWTEDGKRLYYTVGYFTTQEGGFGPLQKYKDKPIGDRRDLTLGQIYEQWSEKAYETLDRGQSTVQSQLEAHREVGGRADPANQDE